LVVCCALARLRPEKKESRSAMQSSNKFGRDDWIPTRGLVVPNDARYRAALHPAEGQK
jgi:hypothetical protein